ncbi:MAG: hypothetical protein CL812_01730 [Confluentimicrobium sp.]|nr:hypothetical protein [Actibacterium sp.]
MIRARLAPPAAGPRHDFGLAQVNIVLLLVLFFLVVGTIVETDELAIDPAVTQDLPLERLPRPLLVLTPGGGWLLDGAEVDRATALARLTETREALPTVHLLAPRDLPAEDLLATVEALRPAGLAITLVPLRASLDGAAPL